MQPKFLGHQACPECQKKGRDRSGNNLGVWEDHSFCFFCGYTERDSFSGLTRIANKANDNKENNGRNLALPSDCTDDLPLECIKWLDKYELTQNEKDKFLWSEEYRRLIYPVYDISDNLVMYQGRKFPNDGQKHSKYHTGGIPEKVLHTIGEQNTRIIVVEDIVSALKVGRQACCMPLWGSQIGPERIRMLSDRFERLWIWLDKDKAEYSLKSRLNALPFFKELRSIITDKDPKEYSDNQIMEILNGTQS